MSSQLPVYLDHGASTPVDPRVIAAMQPYWSEQYGNPSSMHHQGRLASQGVMAARRTFAELLNGRPDEIIFTGCGSESDNLALRGVMWAARRDGRGNHLITCRTEHKAVVDTARQLRDLSGFDVTILGVGPDGRIDLDELRAAIRPDTVLISLMAANNEIGNYQPFLEAGAIARERGILFHTDAVQAAAMLAWDMATMPIDLMSLAPHKFYGPKGVGVLYARQGVDLVASQSGGGQEDGRRAGTTNVPLVVGAAEAFRLAQQERAANVAHYGRLRERLIDGLLAALPGDCIVTGHRTDRLPHNASFAFRDVGGNDLLIQLDVAGICASSGSACKTGDPKPSAVLEALGLSSAYTRGGLRFTVGRQNSDADVDRVLAVLPDAVDRLRQFSLSIA